MEDDVAKLDKLYTEQDISIHVPRVEDDLESVNKFVVGLLFQSTSPVWRTTTVEPPAIVPSTISIHVPRVEDDD